MEDGGGGLFPDTFDRIYFKDAPWSERLATWIDEHRRAGFSHGNVDVVRQLINDRETGLRMVVNITADALLTFLREGRYRNVYDEPVIGGQRREPTENRKKVDGMLSVGKGFYFGALALGGAGVRYYGEYCLVLDEDAIPEDTGLLDRDSYDLLLAPLAPLGPTPEQIDRLRGVWGRDKDDMAQLKVLPDVVHTSRLVTSGTISELLLKDQEFIEIHLHKYGGFGPADLEEVRQSPDDAAMEMTISERERRGLFTTAVEREWARRRAHVARALDAENVKHRIVTLHGRGYQWK